MNEILKTIEAAVYVELERAIKERGYFVDTNHAYGVIAEEIHEAEKEARNARAYFGYIERDTFEDDLSGLRVDAEALKVAAIRAAAEFVQVAAMADKALIFVDTEVMKNE